MGRVTERSAKTISLGLFLGAESLVTVSMILRPSAMLLLVMLADFSLRILYSSPPVRLKRFPLLGNLIASSFVVLLPLLASISIASKSPAAIVGTGVVMFLNSLGTFIMEDVVTEAGDRTVGDRTLPVLLGKRWSTSISSFIYAAALSVLLLGLTASELTLRLLASVAEASLVAIPIFVTEGLPAFRAAGVTAAIVGAILVLGQILA
jgi:4-hydroxybenzoate polyprenyltransferase